MALREVLAKFGFDFDKGKLDQVSKHVEKTKEHVDHATHAGHGLLGLFAGHFVFHALENFVEGIANTAVGLKHLSDQTGLSTENIQLFEFGAGLAGIKTEEFELAVRKLSLSLGKNGEGAKEQTSAFQQLHIATTNADGSTRSLNEILPEIVSGFGEIEDPSKKAKLAVDLFGRSGVKLVGFLSKGKEGLAELKAEFEEYGGGFTEESIHAAERFEEEQVRLNLAFTSFKALLAEEIFPAIGKLIHFFSGIVRHVREFSKHTELAKGTMIALGIAGAIALAHLLAPFAPVIAAVAALSLGLDDLVNFLEGNDSVIGDALNKFLGPGGAEKVRDYLNTIGEEVKTFFTDLIQHPKEFFKKFQDMIDAFIKQNPVLNFLTGGKGTAAFGNEQNDPFNPNAGFNTGDAGSPGAIFDAIAKSNKDYGEAATQQVKTGIAPQPSQDWFASLANSLFGGNAPAVAGLPSLPTTAPVPGQALNQIDQQNRITINVTADTPDDVKAAVEKGATNALGNERRAALATLEQTAR